MNVQLIAYTSLAVGASFAYYFAGKYGRILWNRVHRTHGRRR